MFQDREEELERLTSQLQEQAEIVEADEDVCEEMPAVYNTDTTEVTPEELSEALQEAESQKIPSLKGYVLAVLILTLGVLGMVIYWLKLGGLL